MNPGDAQLRAQSELQSGESLSWTGTADPRRASITALPAAVFGIPFAGFALFWMYGAFHATSALHRSSSNAFTRGFAIFPLFGLPFLLMGLGVILAPLWAYLKAASTVYAVTNQRVMIITGSTNRAVKSYTPADILSVEHRERPDGSGDVILRTNNITPTTTRSSSFSATIGPAVILFGVPNVKDVAAQVMTLHTQRPAA